jgi:hypothetical protein
MKQTLTLALIASLSATALAETQTFIGDSSQEPKILSFSDTGNWESGTLPTSSDEVLITKGRFLYEPQDDAEQRVRSLVAEEFGGFIYKGAFGVETDIQARILTIGASARLFEWGGTLTLSTPNHWDVALELYGGLNKDGLPRVQGANLVTQGKGKIIFVFYGSIPKRLPENLEPLIKLSGSIEFSPQSSIILEARNFQSPLPKGSYFLIEAQNVVGDPELLFKGWDGVPAGAKLVTDGGRISVVIE